MIPDASSEYSMPRLMSEGHRYRHAPIVEAIIDLHCSLPPDVDLGKLAHLTDGDDDYPTHEPRVELTAQLEVDGEEFSGTSNSRQVGHLFRRADGTHAVQAGLDRFAFSWLPPYDEWQPFVEETERWWLKYKELAAPTMLNRVSVRFINRINVPAASIEISDYLRTNLQISALLPQTLNSFLLQAVVPLDRFSSMSRITSTLVPPDQPSGTSIILDIEVWRDLTLDLAGDKNHDTEINEALADLRRAKNYVFEASITDATRSLIN